MRVQGLPGDSEARPEASEAAVARGLRWLQCHAFRILQLFVRVVYQYDDILRGEGDREPEPGCSNLRSEQGGANV